MFPSSTRRKLALLAVAPTPKAGASTMRAMPRFVLLVLLVPAGLALTPNDLPRVTPVPSDFDATPNLTYYVSMPANISYIIKSSARPLIASTASSAADVGARLSLANKLEQAAMGTEAPPMQASRGSEATPPQPSAPPTRSAPSLMAPDRSSASSSAVASAAEPAVRRGRANTKPPSLAAAATLASQVGATPSRGVASPRPRHSPKPRPHRAQALVSDFHVVRDMLSEALADFHNQSGGVGVELLPPQERAAAASAVVDPLGFLQPLELAVAALIVVMIFLAALGTVAIWCNLPYPGRSLMERRTIARKRAEAAAKALREAEEERREGLEREAMLRAHLKASVSPNVAWGGRRSF